MKNYTCPRCGKSYPIRENRWMCDCGSILELEPTVRFNPERVIQSRFSMWRYAAMLPVDAAENIISLGEGMTPLAQYAHGKNDLLLKLEFTNPTGSFKDRGATVLVSKLFEEQVNDVVEDSSGNAGAALAAYAAHAGIRCKIFVPAGHSSVKLQQIKAYGADLVAVAGSRKDTANAALDAARSSYYASHAHSPLYVEGCKTMAYEIWEQTGGDLPDMVISPVGQGAIVLGLYKGFEEMVADGYARKMPRLIGVQAEACDPLARAFAAGLDRALPVEIVGNTIAEGIKISDPVRDVDLLRMFRASRGAVISVGETEIAQAAKDLICQGFIAEPTSAVTLAGYRRMQAQGAIGTCVLVLTGSGLKTLQAH